MADLLPTPSPSPSLPASQRQRTLCECKATIVHKSCPISPISCIVDQLHRWSGSVQDGLPTRLTRTRWHRLGRARGILHCDGGKMLIVAMILGVVDRHASRPFSVASMSVRAYLPAHRRHRRHGLLRFGVQLRQGGRQILGVHVLVRRLLVLHLPPVRWTWWRRDEEQFLALGCMQMLIDGVDRGGASEEDAHTVSDDILAIENLTYPNGGFDVVE